MAENPRDPSYSGEPEQAHDREKLVAERRAKLKALREKGFAYQNDFQRRHLAADLVEKHEKTDRDALDLNPVVVKVSGRIMLKRTMGKITFANIQDMSGQIQIFVADNAPGKEVHEAFKHYDIGDIIGVSGVLFKTRTDELTVRVRELKLLAKSLRPLPEKFHGLTDQELRYRQRYVDLMVNDDSRLLFVQRSRIIQAIRTFLLNRRYLEVETPMMQPIPGGAVARPFVTHHNALDMELFLRIAPELYLKRLVVGGFEKVFEINRNFRNEGISTKHNPEFTMLELYAAHTDYEYMMSTIPQILLYAAKSALGTTKLTYQGHEIDLAQPYQRLTITQAIRQHHPGASDAVLNDRDALLARLKELNIAYRPADGIGGLRLTLFENTVEDKLIQPTFILDYPAEVSPLARRSDQNPEIAERFELYIAGREIANGFSELNDPAEQAARFQQQVKQKEAGDAEAMHYDADYIRALEYGMPPASGAGVGIDRVVMLFTDSPSIRDVILFPLLRPEER
ncbi:MAG: lysine--tRNA ligase [Betaproteobacteria bacterium]|nr:lysine--tRNA ligase [Betaproteobacteria bacterium]